MTEMEAVIRNKNGIHCRPSAVIFKAAEKYPGKITISAGHEQVPLTSILNLLSLGLKCKVKILIRVSGPEEEAVCERLVRLFELKFDFPPKSAAIVFDPGELAHRYRIYPVEKQQYPDLK